MVESSADTAARRFRSEEEMVMRHVMVDRLRERWPSARIIHELPLRYSSRRIDLAAVTADNIVAVEIKSSADTMDRLAGQLGGFLPIVTKMIVAMAPKWLEPIPPERKTVTRGPRKGAVETHYRRPHGETAVQTICEGHDHVELWCVDADAKEARRHGYLGGHVNAAPWGARLLNILHVAELESIAHVHRLPVPTRHDRLVTSLANQLNGREILLAACQALRARAAFAVESDPPIEPSPAAGGTRVE